MLLRMVGDAALSLPARPCFPPNRVVSRRGASGSDPPGPASDPGIAPPIRARTGEIRGSRHTGACGRNGVKSGRTRRPPAACMIAGNASPLPRLAVPLGWRDRGRILAGFWICGFLGRRLNGTLLRGAAAPRSPHIRISRGWLSPPSDILVTLPPSYPGSGVRRNDRRESRRRSLRS